MSTANIEEEAAKVLEALGQLDVAATERLRVIRKERQGNQTQLGRISNGARLAVQRVLDIDAPLAEEESQLASALEGGVPAAATPSAPAGDGADDAATTGEPAASATGAPAAVDLASAPTATTPSVPAPADPPAAMPASELYVPSEPVEPAAPVINWYSVVIGILLALIGLAVSRHTSHWIDYQLFTLHHMWVGLMSVLWSVVLTGLGLYLGIQIGHGIYRWTHPRA